MPWFESFPKPKPGQQAVTITGEPSGECLKIFRRDGLEWIRIKRPNGVTEEWTYSSYAWKAADSSNSLDR